MLIADAQSEVRTVHLGGFVGQLVSAVIWLASAATATWVNPPTGFWTLALGGVAIFPLTQVLQDIQMLAPFRPNPAMPEHDWWVAQRATRP